MSTILKALRRLEDDRNALSQRPLREEVATEGGEPARAKRIRVLGFAVLALCVAGGAGTFAFLSARESPVELASGAVEPVLEPAARARPERSEPPERARSIPEAEVAAAPPDLAPPPPRGLPPMAFASDVEVVARPLPSPRLLEPGPPARIAEQEAVAAAGAWAPVMESPERRSQVRYADSPGTFDDPPPPPEPVASSEPASPPASEPAAEPDPPSPPEPVASAGLPREIARAVVPNVSVQETHWHPDASRRAAVLKVEGAPREVREGDLVGPLVISTIEPSGVVFEHEGVEMRRRVGE